MGHNKMICEFSVPPDSERLVMVHSTVKKYKQLTCVH